MIYKNKIPATDNNLSVSLVNNGWTKIKEPKNLISAILLSIPFMTLNAIIVVFATPIKLPISEILDRLNNGGIVLSINISLLLYAVAVFLFLFIHELLHAVCVPNFIKSKKTFWGITPFGGFVFTTEELSKARFILISVLPVIVLSIITPWLFSFIGLLNGFVTFLVFMNALASSIDILNMFLIIVQVPSGSRIVNNGFETYHKR